jgi:hypothetical protein
MLKTLVMISMRILSAEDYGVNFDEENFGVKVKCHIPTKKEFWDVTKDTAVAPLQNMGDILQGRRRKVTDTINGKKGSKKEYEAAKKLQDLQSASKAGDACSRRSGKESST